MPCSNEHTAHVEPDQRNPRRFWITCGDKTLAEYLVGNEGTDTEKLQQWFRLVLRAHAVRNR